MKTSILQSFFVACLLIPMSSCKDSNKNYIVLSNPLNIIRTNEVIEFPISEFIKHGSKIPSGKLPLLTMNNDTLVTQFLDTNEDGKMDRILILISFDENEKKHVKIDYINEDSYPIFKNRTNIHFALRNEPKKEIDTLSRTQSKSTDDKSNKLQMEGPAWENDKVGFRNYFDLRNGMDIYGKVTSDMVLDKAGLHRTYHKMDDWGMDILKVANSLGAGAIAISYNDSLYRVGDNGFGKYKLLYKGPLRSSFRFSFPDWTADGKYIQLTHDVVITAGKYCYENHVSVNDPTEDIQLVTGIVNKYADSLIVENAAKEYKILLSNAKQAEDSAYLGMAIMMPENNLIDHGRTPDTGPGITETFLAKMKLFPDKATNYYFYAFWATSDPSFESNEKLLKIMDMDAQMIENPIILLNQ